jgi:hypothetical protein
MLRTRNNNVNRRLKFAQQTWKRLSAMAFQWIVPAEGAPRCKVFRNAGVVRGKAGKMRFPGAPVTVVTVAGEPEHRKA